MLMVADVLKRHRLLTQEEHALFGIDQLSAAFFGSVTHVDYSAVCKQFTQKQIPFIMLSLQNS